MVYNRGHEGYPIWLASAKLLVISFQGYDKKHESTVFQKFIHISGSTMIIQYVLDDFTSNNLTPIIVI